MKKTLKKFQLSKETITNLESGFIAGGYTGIPCGTYEATACVSCTCPDTR